MTISTKSFIEVDAFRDSITKRRRNSNLWRRIYLASIGFSVLALVILFAKIVDDSFGYIAIANAVNPVDLQNNDGYELNEQSVAELSALLRDHKDDSGVYSVSTDRLFAVFLEEVANTKASPAELRDLTLRSALSGDQEYPQDWGERTILDLRLPQSVDRSARDTMARKDIALLLQSNLPAAQLLELVYSDIIQSTLLRSWNLIESLTEGEQIRAFVSEEYPGASLNFHSWINDNFLQSPSSNHPLTSGIRVAILGSLWMLLIALGASLPIGVAAAIYLEEYARGARTQGTLLRWINNFIEVNIRNLAGVPSIIYGMLGLAVFVRALEELTSGRIMGMVDSDGRTILSAGLTMALLILPVIIISAQESIRAVPQSIREASYGLGATQWQTISRQVLPVALPGILTGVILSVSRALGETAPLVVVGAATTIFIDPSGPFAKFTVLPIQIYRWTADSRAGFQDTAAATIVVLLTMLIALNALAILLRNRFSARNRKLG